MGGESGTHAGLIPEFVHTRDENKGIKSPSEQGHMDLSKGLKGLLSLDNTALVMSTPHHSQSVVAYNAESSRSSNLAKRVQLRGSVNQLNSLGSNLQQGKHSKWSSIALNNLPENSRSPTSPRAPTSFERTASRVDNPPRQQPTHLSHTGIDTLRLQPPMVHRTASCSDVSTRTHRTAPPVDATGGSRGTTERPSGSSVGLNPPPPPTSPPPASLSPGNNDPRAYSNNNLSISGSSMAARPGAPTVQHPYHRPEASQSQRIVSR